VPIASIDSVRGDWTGRIVKSPAGPREDWIDLTIGGDGSYRYTAYRAYNMLAGSGKLTLVGGELHSESTSGKATYRLTTGVARASSGSRPWRRPAYITWPSSSLAPAADGQSASPGPIRTFRQP
jgi:hypothetical protein